MITIISGGQTGVDRAALDAAMELGFPVGGWCPEGRVALDGRIPDRYPLKEVTGGYRVRTEKNAKEADGTLLFKFGAISSGTALTLNLCKKHGKPHILIDGNDTKMQVSADMIVEFIKQHDIQTLNIAGPRLTEFNPVGIFCAKESIKVALSALQREGKQT